jgi:hypothetical protein
MFAPIRGVMDSAPALNVTGQGCRCPLETMEKNRHRQALRDPNLETSHARAPSLLSRGPECGRIIYTTYFMYHPPTKLAVVGVANLVAGDCRLPRRSKTNSNANLLFVRCPDWGPDVVGSKEPLVTRQLRRKFAV